MNKKELEELGSEITLKRDIQRSLDFFLKKYKIEDVSFIGILEENILELNIEQYIKLLEIYFSDNKSKLLFSKEDVMNKVYKKRNKEKQLNNYIILSNQVKSDLIRGEKNHATERIVRFIKKKYTIKTTRSDDRCEMWIYIGGIYLPQARTYIQEETRKIIDNLYSTYFLNQIISKIEADTFIDQDLFFNKQNETPELIPVNNGVLNIRTKELIPFTPKIYFFNKLEMDYNPKSKIKNIYNFIEDILPEGKIDLIETIQELFGYSLLKEYRIERSFMLEGTGRNGKSKLLSLLQRFVGAENVSSISLKCLEEEDSFIISNIQNKLVNISSDLSSEAINNTGKFKELTGRDTIIANRKFKNHVSFVNYAKMIFSCNELPNINDLNDGFWLRWILISFPYQFLPQKEINLLEEKQKKFVKLQDPDIIEKLTSKIEMEGLLVWALEGYERICKNKDFSYNPSKNDVKNIWLRKSNSVLAFCQDCIISDYDSEITKHDFRRLFSSYCKKHKVKPVSDKSIKITLENEYGATYKRPYIEGKQKHVWDGIKFNEVTVVTLGTGFFELRKKNNDTIKLVHKNKISQISQKRHPLLPHKEVGEFTYRGKVGGKADLPCLNEEKNIENIHTNSPNEYINEHQHILLKLFIENYPGDNDIILIKYFGNDFISDMIKQGEIIEIKPGTIRMM